MTELCDYILILEGRLIGGVDENGITYYNNLINELKANGKLEIKVLNHAFLIILLYM